MKPGLTLSLALILLTLPLFAQKNKTDELAIALKKHHAADNEQLRLLNELSLAYANVQYDSGFVVVARAIALAEKLNNPVQLAAAYNNKGYILLRKSQFEQSKENFKKALSLYSSLQDKNGMADCYAYLAELDNWQGENPDEMDEFIRKALNLYEETNNTIGMAQCSYLFARWNEFGDLDSAVIFSHTRKAIYLFDQAGNKTGKASTLDFIAVTYEIHSDYVNAFQYYQQAIDLNTLTGNLFGLCNDYINISGCYLSTDNYSKAIECAVKGLKLGEQLGDIDAQILMLGILGDTYNVTNQNDKALQCLEQGYKMAVEIGSKKRMAHMLTSLHTIYMEKNNFPKAFESLYMVLKIDKEMNSSADMADDYTKLAEAYMKLSKYDSALVNYQHSFTLLKDIGENATYANNLLWYGKTINETPASQLRRAGINPDSRNSIYKENINRALEVSSKIGVYSTQRDALLELSSISENEEDLKKSLYYYKKYVVLKDTIMNAENSNSINNLQIQYGTEKKEQQIVLLNKDNVIKQKEIGKQKVIRNSVIGGLSIVSGFLLLVFIQRNKIKKGKKLSDELLLNILPSETAEELKATGAAKAKRFDSVTVMFTDFKNFTQASEKLSAEELVGEINYCYSEFDKIITKYGIEKIKTIGDSYMCAGGLPITNSTHPFDVVNAGIEMQQFILNNKKEREDKGLPFFELRLGINTGPVVAGIVGIKKFAYDIWGDTVNIASRMESCCEEGKINISGTTHELVKAKYSCSYRGKIEAKNKGFIDMYFVEASIPV